MKTTQQPQSILRSIAEQVQNEKDLETAKNLIINHVTASRMADKDKRQIKMCVQYQIFTHTKLVQFIYNNILKFEGLGVI